MKRLLTKRNYTMNSRKINERILTRSAGKTEPNWLDVNTTVRAKYSAITNPVAIIQLDSKPLCSGFLINNQTLMSAGHCDQMEVCRKDYDEYGADRYQIVFGYDQKENEKSTARSYSVKEIKGFYKCDNKHDVALFKLCSDAAYKKFGKLGLQEKYVLNQKIAVAHHPDGQTKKFSPGKVVASYPERGLFGHTADTQGGSSGAPVISLCSKKAIGVHVQGDSKENYALPVSVINKAFKNR